MLLVYSPPEYSTRADFTIVALVFSYFQHCATLERKKKDNDFFAVPTKKILSLHAFYSFYRFQSVQIKKINSALS